MGVAWGASLARDLWEGERKNWAWTAYGQKGKACPEGMGDEGFLSRGGSWGRRKRRKGCQNASEHNVTDCSAVTCSSLPSLIINWSTPATWAHSYGAASLGSTGQCRVPPLSISQPSVTSSFDC